MMLYSKAHSQEKTIFSYSSVSKCSVNFVTQSKKVKALLIVSLRGYCRKAS